VAASLLIGRALQNRERVLDAATELIRGEGEKVPMARIAERAGVGVGTVYRHFATRGELVEALVHRSFGLAVDNARAAAEHPGPAAGELRADLTPEDLIVAASLLSRPLPGSGDWDALAHRQIDFTINGLGPAVRPGPASR